MNRGSIGIAVLMTLLIIVVLLYSIVQLLPMEIQHVWQSIQTATTKDLLVHEVSCGPKTLQLWQTDSARSGQPRSIDYEGYPPHIEQTIVLRALSGGRQVFEAVPDYGNQAPRSGNIWLDSQATDPPTEKEFFVFDREGFNHIGEGMGATIVTITSKSGVSEQEVRDAASCYAKSFKELNSIWKRAIVGFSYISNGEFKAETFSCPTGRSVTITKSGQFLVDGDETKFIGHVLADGAFRPLPEDYMPKTVSAEDRLLYTWKSCKTSEGKTVQDYINSSTPQMVYVD